MSEGQEEEEWDLDEKRRVIGTWRRLYRDDLVSVLSFAFFFCIGGTVFAYIYTTTVVAYRLYDICRYTGAVEGLKCMA